MEAIEIKDFNSLPFGENTNQAAMIAPIENSVEYEILSDNDILEYIDYLNLSRVVEILAEFFDVHATAIAKENKLCAVALGSSNNDALEKVIDCDPLVIGEGTIGFSKEIDLDVAKLIGAMQIRNIIAPKYTKEAIDYFTSNTGCNVIQIKNPLQEILGFNAKDIKVTPFGYLVQDQNPSKLTKTSFKVAGKIKPTQQQAEDAIFAWKIAKYSQSKTAIIAKDLATKAIIQGRTNRVEAVENAMDFACENSKDAVLAVDGAIEKEEIIFTAIQGRIGLIIEAGNSAHTDKILNLADKYQISMIITGLRNNKY